MKRTKQEQIRGIQEVLERHRRFDLDYIPYLGTWRMPDGNYHYRQRGMDAFWTGFWRTLMFLFGWILTGVCFGARVTGKKNLRAIGKGGAICVCNHFNYLDTLFVRQAVGHYRSYHTMGPKNNKNGFGGWVMRHGGMLTFSSDHAAARNLNDEIERLLKKGKIINFYAEQAMWTNYQKPRPMLSNTACPFCPSFAPSAGKRADISANCASISCPRCMRTKRCPAAKSSTR